MPVDVQQLLQTPAEKPVLHPVPSTQQLRAAWHRAYPNIRNTPENFMRVVTKLMTYVTSDRDGVVAAYPQEEVFLRDMLTGLTAGRVGLHEERDLAGHARFHTEIPPSSPSIALFLDRTSQECGAGDFLTLAQKHQFIRKNKIVSLPDEGDRRPYTSFLCNLDDLIMRSVQPDGSLHITPAMLDGYMRQTPKEAEKLAHTLRKSMGMEVTSDADGGISLRPEMARGLGDLVAAKLRQSRFLDATRPNDMIACGYGVERQFYAAYPEIGQLLQSLNGIVLHREHGKVDIFSENRTNAQLRDALAQLRPNIVQHPLSGALLQLPNAYCDSMVRDVNSILEQLHEGQPAKAQQILEASREKYAVPVKAGERPAKPKPQVQAAGAEVVPAKKTAEQEPLNAGELEAEAVLLPLASRFMPLFELRSRLLDTASGEVSIAHVGDDKLETYVLKLGSKGQAEDFVRKYEGLLPGFIGTHAKPPYRLDDNNYATELTAEKVRLLERKLEPISQEMDRIDAQNESDPQAAAAAVEALCQEYAHLQPFKAPHADAIRQQQEQLRRSAKEAQSLAG